jgi:hypothetical protein
MLVPLVDAETLRNTVTPEVYMAVFDDRRTKDPSSVDQSGPVQEVIDDANALVISSLAPICARVPDGTDPAIPVLLKTVSRLYLRYFTFIRRPEYTRVTGKDEASLLKHAKEIVDEIRSGLMAVAPNDGTPKVSVGNVGGIVYESGPRLMTDSLDGTSNSGDF